MTKVTISYKQLDKLGACSAQLRLFRRFYGDEVTFTNKDMFISEAVRLADVFNFGWAAFQLCKGPYRYTQYIQEMNPEKEKNAKIFAIMYWEQETTLTGWLTKLLHKLGFRYGTKGWHYDFCATWCRIKWFFDDLTWPIVRLFRKWR